MIYDPAHLPDYVTNASVALAILGAPAMILKARYKKVSHSLEDIFVGASAASAIPTGLVLLYGAFRPQIIPTLRGLNVQIAAAGLALLYVSLRKLLI